MKVKTSDVPLDQTETGTPHRNFFNLFYFKFSFSETSWITIEHLNESTVLSIF